MPVYGRQDKLTIGKECAIQNTLFNTTCGTVTLEDYVSFGHNVMVLTGYHDYTLTNKARQESWTNYTENHIVLEEGVWVASGAIIIGPCTIGKHSVVGAGSVVRPGVYPERSLLVGSPAKIIRTIETV